MTNKASDQSARMYRLVYTLAFRNPLKTGFLASRPILFQFHVLLLIVLNFTTVDILFYFDRINVFHFHLRDCDQNVLLKMDVIQGIRMSSFCYVLSRLNTR